MNKLFLALLLFFTLQANANDFKFPNIDYAYARLYLYHIPLGNHNFFKTKIYTDSSYASSKLGNGFMLDTAFFKAFNSILKPGIQDLLSTMSRCYIPRHGIVYYDKNHEPVASMSICFECTRIELWSIKEIDYTPYLNQDSTGNSSKQMAALRKLFIKNRIPVKLANISIKMYQDYLAKDTLNKAKKVIIIDSLTSFLNLPTTINQKLVLTWLSDKNSFLPEEIETTEIYTADEGLIYKTISQKDKFEFTFENGALRSATIYDFWFHLPNRIKLGMSIEELYLKLNYGALKYPLPNLFFLEGSNWLVTLTFEYFTLVKIEINKLE